MDEALRKDVRFLTTRLGAILREQCGERVFNAIERLRRLSRQIRHETAEGAPSAELVRQNDAEVRRLSLGAASDVAHAFSLFFHLVNLCEERQRVRRLRQYEQQESGARISLRHTFRELRDRGVSPKRLARFLATMRIEPVLTAHPTEAKRRSVLNHILRINRTLDSLTGDLPGSAGVSPAGGAVAERAIDPWIEALWLTDEVRERSVTPEVEIENTLVYLERTIYDLAGIFWDKVRDELGRSFPEIRPPEPFLRFGSWVGSDRDGNPNVTPAVSLDAAEQLRQSVLAYYRQSCERMLGILSLPLPRNAAAQELRRSVEGDMRRFPATLAFERVDQPNEYYRRKLRIMSWRLERTARRRPGAYAGPEEFVHDAELLERAVAHHPSPRIARQGPGRLAVAARVFAFHGAALDFRQHVSATRAAVDAILRAARLPAEPAAARIRSIQRLLVRGRAVAARRRRRALDEFGALREIQRLNGPGSAPHYIISMAGAAADIWDVLLLGRRAGLVSAALEGSFDVIPLFETFDDLHAGPQILDRLLSDRMYRKFLRSRGNFQEVMLGYSDSVKDSGYLAANWALFLAQKELGAVARRHGVQLGLFHGKGGTIDRGGGMSYRMLQAEPHAAPGGRLRITEQGEVISLKYSNPAIALRNVEELAASALDAYFLQAGDGTGAGRGAAEPSTEWQSFAEQMAADSRRFYRALVYETPEFPSYFYQATPIDLIEQLRLGSRPSRRFRTDDLRAMRAIPWVFAWTQSRHFLPSWYGLGHALEQFVARHAPRGLELLREMYRGWPFFGVLLENAEISLAKTDLYIAGRYAALARPARLGENIFRQIREEYERSVRLVLEISGNARLLARQPVLSESIRLRNPYVDPLNYLQIRFLERWRRDRRPPPELLHLLQITVGGVAFGMKSTG